MKKISLSSSWIFVLIFVQTLIFIQTYSVYSFAGIKDTSTNYEYGIFVVRNLLPEIQASMKLSEIIDADKAHNKVKEAVIQSLLESQADLFKGLIIDGNLAEINLQKEILKALQLFNQRLLFHLKQVEVQRDLTFQIHFAPQISKVLKLRRSAETVTPRIYYPSDRINVIGISEMDKLPLISEVGADAKDVILTDIYQGMAARLSDQYRSQGQSQGQNPFFVSMTINLTLSPLAHQSRWVVKAVVGMPVNKSIPFTEGNEQIQFQRIEFPNFDLGNLGMSAEHLPTALITLEQPLDAPANKMLVEFGPIATFTEDGWVRPKDAKAFSNYAPRLIGTPQKWVKNKVEVVFNILNLAVDLADLSVTDLDLFLSVGLPQLPITRIGFINRPDVDNQFITEINKSIASAIEDQEKKLNDMGLARIDKLTGFAPPVIQKMIEDIFTVNLKKAGNRIFDGGQIL